MGSGTDLGNRGRYWVPPGAGVSEWAVGGLCDGIGQQGAHLTGANTDFPKEGGPGKC